MKINPAINQLTNQNHCDATRHILGQAFSAGSCSRARAGGQDVDCDEDGNFEPLQCRRTDSRGVFRCVCREPEGEVVPGTEVEVEDRDDAPDCDDEGIH